MHVMEIHIINDDPMYVCSCVFSRDRLSESVNCVLGTLAGWE